MAGGGTPKKRGKRKQEGNAENRGMKRKQIDNTEKPGGDNTENLGGDKESLQMNCSPNAICKAALLLSTKSRLWSNKLGSEAC